MTFEEFKILVKGLKAVYTSDKFLPDADSVKIWYALLKDLDYASCNAAIQRYIMTNKFPPTIADIRDGCASVKHGTVMDWSEGWSEIMRTINRYGWCNEPRAMASLSPMTRKVVECMGYQNLCQSENQTADRANFRMIWENLQSREWESNVLSLPLQEQIRQIAGQIGMIEGR